MTDETATGLRADYQRMADAMASAPDSETRAALKSEIVALFRRTESTIADLAAFKETIRELITQYKSLPDPVATAPTVRHDHLGATTFIERGWTELAGGNWTAAEAMLRRATLLDGTSASAQSLLGWALTHQGRFDEALELCQRVLQREPEHGLAHVTIGVICLRKRIVGEAIEHLSRVASTGGDPRASLYANYWLGVAYMEREMYGDAVEFLRRALALGPNLGEGWAELGRALWFVGQSDDAREAWTVGSRVRFSPYAARCAEMLEATGAGGTPPRLTPH